MPPAFPATPDYTGDVIIAYEQPLDVDAVYMLGIGGERHCKPAVEPRSPHLDFRQSSNTLVVEIQENPGGGGSAGQLFPAHLRNGEARRVQIKRRFSLGVGGIEGPVGEIDPDRSGEPFREEVEI